MNQKSNYWRIKRIDRKVSTRIIELFRRAGQACLALWDGDHRQQGWSNNISSGQW